MPTENKNDLADLSDDELSKLSSAPEVPSSGSETVVEMQQIETNVNTDPPADAAASTEVAATEKADEQPSGDGQEGEGEQADKSSDADKLDKSDAKNDEDSSALLGLSDDEIAKLDLKTLGSKPKAEVKVNADLVKGDEDKKDEKVEDKSKEIKALVDAPKTGAKADEKPVDFQKAYEAIMAPFKANGKVIQAQTPDEAIKLMQLGANYTQKMQKLAPNLKLMQALDNNKLLDQGNVDFLIDLAKGNPDAINRLLKEKSIDPLDLDVATEKVYTPTNHSVSDAQMTFQSALDDALSTPEGKATVAEIEQNWDTLSHQRIRDEPEILQVIQFQRENGLYAQITAEIDRQKTLGNIKPNTTFLDAYKATGDSLHNSGKLMLNGVPTNKTDQSTVEAPKVQAPTQTEVKTPVEAPKMLATRPAAPRPAVKDDARAKAAGSTRTSPSKKTPTDFNPLTMSDEEFLKIGNMNI